MTFSEIHEILQKEISKKRFSHIEGVVESAEDLAQRYGCSVEKAKLAALLHDCCKEYKVDDLKSILSNTNDPFITQEFLTHIPLLHGPAGAIVSKERFGIVDVDVLEAIKVHTTGKSNMSLLDKIVFLADYIEKNRDFPGVKKLRKVASKNLDEAVLMGYDTTISFLIEEKKPIFTGTIVGRNDLLTTMKV